MRVIKDKVLRGKARKVILYLEGVFWIEGFLHDSRVRDFVRLTMVEAYYSRYVIYLG